LPLTGTFPFGKALPQLHRSNEGLNMRSIVLWLVGVPIPIIILLWFFMR
jgi:hypothetical protein